jgi:hypothetical protein
MTPISITNEPAGLPALDFNYLREEGIRHLQRLAGSTWTDHNLHDPGITILDQLCYALTELSYRVSFDTRELLARPDDSTFNSLYSPATILTNNPVTLADFRKVLLDVPGVRNAWIEPEQDPQPPIYFDEVNNVLTLDAEPQISPDYPTPGKLTRLGLKGLYRISVAKSGDISPTQLLGRVSRRLFSCRNLCEDFDSITIIEEELITIGGKIEVGSTDDVNLLAARILYRVVSWLSPAISFYTLPEMLAKGAAIEDIMDGPRLDHGFIDDEELTRFSRRTRLYASDLIREIMKEPGIRVMDDLLMLSPTAVDNWVLNLDGARVPVLDERRCLAKLQFRKEGRTLRIDEDAVHRFLADMKHKADQPALKLHEKDLVPSAPPAPAIGEYFSIQEHFPVIYGLGEMGLPESASPARKAQLRQLQGYLLFFEQILANYFSQAAGLKNLFAFDHREIRTYFSQSLAESVPGIEHVLDDNYEAALADITEEPGLAMERKHRFLNHLLARFGESFADYSVWLHDQALAGEEALRNDAKNSGKSSGQAFGRARLSADKLSFLANYPALSAARGKSFDYSIPPEGPSNASGIEERIAGKLGIRNAEAFYMIEHILLRPLPADRAQIDKFKQPRSITSLSRNTDGTLTIQSPQHGLRNGETVILSSPKSSGEFVVSEALVNEFTISAAKESFSPSSVAVETLSWKRKEISSVIFAFTGKSADDSVRDPYSLQLTFVFSLEADSRFRNENFKKFIETTIREETPAHLTVYIKWLDEDAFGRFREAYQLFREQLAGLKQPMS